VEATFGKTLDGPLAEIIVRNWGVLVVLVGAMLIYGAFDARVRPMVLVVANASKVVFIGLVLLYGRQYLTNAAIPIGVDVVMMAVFIGTSFGEGTLCGRLQRPQS
jgi:hypothetical protein